MLKTRERCSLSGIVIFSNGAGAREPLEDKSCFNLYSVLIMRTQRPRILPHVHAVVSRSFPRIFTWREVCSLTKERLETKEKRNMAAEASSWLKSYFYAKQSMQRLPLVFLAFRNVFSVVYLYWNATIMPATGCKTHKMGTTLTGLRE